MNTNIETKYYLYGAISGMVGLCLSHPFDTIKTHIQKGSILPNYHLKTLYRGVSTPLVGVGLEKAVVFGTYQNIFKYTNSNMISGAIAGLAASLVVTPIDRVKILLQTSNYNKQNLNIRYLYQGLTVTFTREMPGFAIYFTVYENLKNRIYQQNQITTLGAFMLGGTAGLTAWCFIFPQDCIKTRIQAAKHANKTYGSIINEIYQNGGLKQFYRGFHLALMRAIPLHAGTFATMEYLQRFNKYNIFL